MDRTFGLKHMEKVSWAQKRYFYGECKTMVSSHYRDKRAAKCIFSLQHIRFKINHYGCHHVQCEWCLSCKVYLPFLESRYFFFSVLNKYTRGLFGALSVMRLMTLMQKPPELVMKWLFKKVLHR